MTPTGGLRTSSIQKKISTNSKKSRITIFFFDEIMTFKKICVIHLNQIGDLVFSLPLLKALRENYPSSTIHSIVRPHLKELLVHSPYINDLLYRRKGIKDILILLNEIRKNKYDLLITLSNSGECLFLTTFSGAKVKVGFSYFPWDFSLDIKEKVKGHLSWYYNLKLLETLKIEVQKRDYVGLLTLPAKEDSKALSESKIPDVQGKYVVVSPGTSARRRVKAWEEEKFGDLIILLKEKYDLNPILVGGEDNIEVNDKVIEMVRAKDKDKKVNYIENVAGKLGLKDLCYLLKDASLFVGVDSGIMHLASAFDIPVVGIFGPTDPFYVGPLNKKSMVVREEMECSPCYLKGCEDRTCMKKLEVKKVWDACEELLRK
jgi:lipopolysaccharide heptosyltransferase II